MTPKLIMTKGLPASGKTTWAKSQIKQGGHVKRVNKDDLRAMLDSSNHNKLNEDFVLQTRDSIVAAALARGQTIIVDDTNFAPKHEETLRKIAAEYGATFSIKDFSDVPLEECLKRDAERPNPVGEAVIREMYERYLHKVKVTKARYKLVEEDKNLPKAIICDLDGTLALIGDRSPYDSGKCEGDAVNVPILKILGKFSQDPEYTIIFMSGRESQFKNQTVAWLTARLGECGFVRFNYLMMRETGDNRKDSIVKKELYEQNVKGVYNVEFILDDRDQVVNMWRSLGLTCLQVAPGDF